MTNVLTAIGAALGLVLFLIMAVVPLFLDLPERDEQPRPVEDRPEADRDLRSIPVVRLRMPVQREASDVVRPVAAQRWPVGPRA